MNNIIIPTGEAFPFDEYSINPKNKILLLHAITYEERGFESLKRSVQKFKIRKTLLFLFNIKDYLANETIEYWDSEKQKVISFLKEIKLPFVIIHAKDYEFGDIFKKIKNEILIGDTILVDITTFPKNYILKIAQELGDLECCEIAYQYTLGKRYTEPTEEEKKVGMSKIIPVDGFEGDIKINGEPLLILILGFEGNRTLPFLDEFPAGKTIALIGAPGIGLRKENEEDRYYLTYAEQFNKPLLNNSFVETKKVNTVNPFLFSQQLKSIIESTLQESKPTNIIVVPIGTKAQTLGVYLYWKYNPTIQILYSIPNRRPKIALETGETFIYRFRN